MIQLLGTTFTSSNAVTSSEIGASLPERQRLWATASDNEVIDNVQIFLTDAIKHIPRKTQSPPVVGLLVGMTGLEPGTSTMSR